MLQFVFAALQLITFNLGEGFMQPPQPPDHHEVYRVNQETLVLQQVPLDEDQPDPMLYDRQKKRLPLGAFNNSMYAVQHIADFNGDGLQDVLIEGNTGASSYQTTSYLILSQGKGSYRLQTFYQFVQAYRFDQDKTLHIAAYSPADVKYAQDVSHALWTYWPTLYSFQPGKPHGAYKEDLHRAFYTQKVKGDYLKEIASLRESMSAGDSEARKAIAARRAAIALIDKRFRSGVHP